MSEYGRVMHLDYPTFITRNVSLDQIKEHFKINSSSNIKNSGVLMKINIHRKNVNIAVLCTDQLHTWKKIPKFKLGRNRIKQILLFLEVTVSNTVSLQL